MLQRPKRSGTTVSVRIEPGSASPYLKAGVLRTTYTEVDLDGIPDALLVLPALGTVITVAMAAGVPVEAREVDAEFAAGVAASVPLWQHLHPSFRTAGFELRADPVSTAPRLGGGDMLLWSGGLDSTASLIEHAGTIRSLFTVWGADIQLGDAALWGALNSHFDVDPLAGSLPRVTARSNMRHFPVLLTLAHDFLGLGESWWGRVQHGLALAGLAAPAAAALGASTLIRASSFSPESHQATGSMPELDDLTRWAGVRVRHEGFELSRQAKISQRLAPYLADGGRLNLAVCYRRGRHDAERGVNCGDCEKCLRTAAGLLAAGIDPASVGLPIVEGVYRRWAEKLATGLLLTPQQLPFWREVAADLIGGTQVPAEPEAREFLAAVGAEGALLPKPPRTDQEEFARRYRATRRAERWSRLRATLGEARRGLRRRAAAFTG